MSLIFNEIIEINCFELSKNTKRNIILRAGNNSTNFGNNYTFDSTVGEDGYLIELADEKSME